MWEELYKSSKEALNVAEHLYYVTFKHSKDSAIIKAIIERLAESLEKLIAAIVYYKYEEGKLESFSKNPKMQADLLVKLLEEIEPMEDFNVREFIQYYTMLRKLARAKSEGINDYKRTVRLRLYLPSGEFLEISPKDLKDYFAQVKDYFKKLESYLLSS